MAKRKITFQGTCEKCGNPVSSSSELEIPDTVVEKEVTKEVPVYKEPPQLDLTPITEHLSQLTSAYNELIGAVKGHPHPTEQFIKGEWEDCPSCKAEWEAIKKRIASEALASCPGCKEKESKIAELQEQIKKQIKTEVVEPTAAAAAPMFWWEKEMK